MTSWSTTCSRCSSHGLDTPSNSASDCSTAQRRSYREVGEELGVTAEAARRLVKRAVTTVRDTADAATIDAA